MKIKVADRKALAYAFIDAVNKLASYFSYNFKGYYSGNLDDLLFKFEESEISESGDLLLRSFFMPSKNDNDIVKLDWCVGPQLEVPAILFMPYNGYPVIQGCATHNKALEFCRNRAKGGGSFFCIESLYDPQTILKFKEIGVATTGSLVDYEAQQMEFGWFDDVPFEIIYSFDKRPILKDASLPDELQKNYCFDDRTGFFSHKDFYCILIANKDNKEVEVYQWHQKKKINIEDGFYIRGLRKTNLYLRQAVDLYSYMATSNVWALVGKIEKWGDVELIGGISQFETGILKDYIIPEELAFYVEG